MNGTHCTCACILLHVHVHVISIMNSVSDYEWYIVYVHVNS